jgi:hypothetical protein
MTQLLRFVDRRSSLMYALVVLVLGLLGPSCGSADGARGMTQPTPTTTSAWPDSEPVATLVQHLHGDGSGAEARALIPDLKQTFVDDGHGMPYAAAILPFRYYWSSSAHVTVAICQLGKTVLVCPYYLDRLIRPEEYSSCRVAEIYAGPDELPPESRP